MCIYVYIYIYIYINISQRAILYWRLSSDTLDLLSQDDLGKSSCTWFGQEYTELILRARRLERQPRQQVVLG